MSGESITDFSNRLRTFLEARCKVVTSPGGWGHGSDSLVAAGLTSDRAEPEDVERARQFQAELFDAGLAWLTGPAEYGGAGLSPAHVAAFRAIVAEFDVPDTSVFMIGQEIVAPAILQCGSDAQREHWLRRIWRGETIACQMFSEPDAGSDLASLRCRARTDGDGWRISGQKVWSSGAHLSDVGELLARTADDERLRSRGLSMFLVDMRAPGVEIKPLRQMNGNAHFNEIFLDDVFVPGDALLGARGDGWAVANASLASERDLGVDDAGLYLRPFDRLVELALHSGAAADHVTRQALADVHARRVISNILHESLSSPSNTANHVAANMLKLFDSDLLWRVAQHASRILGPAITADGGDWGTYAWTDVVLSVQSQRIAGGTDEIQRNIISERGLGLPRDPAPTPTSKGAQQP